MRGRQSQCRERAWQPRWLASRRDNEGPRARQDSIQRGNSHIRNRATTSTVSRVDFGRLRQLWASRSDAGEPEWHELYTLVERVLRRAKILDGLDRGDLIQGYFLDRVLAGRGQAVPDNEAALLGWFRNYQLDQVAKERMVGVTWDDGFCTQAGLSTEPAAIDDVLFRDHRAAKVADFFKALKDDEKLLLQISHCDGESVLSVQDQHQICSAHYRSKQLGILLSKSAIPADWAKSKIGRLVDELGVKVERAASADLLQVLRLLCERALEWWEARCNSER